MLWYVFGIHHITRVEDWPIMPVDIISFWLKPFGFFDQNPALDAPSTMSDHSGHSHLNMHLGDDGIFEPVRAERHRPWRTSKVFSNIINGEERPAASGETLDIINPSTGEVYATSPNSGSEDVDAAFQAAAAAFEQYRWTTPSERQRTCSS